MSNDRPASQPSRALWSAAWAVARKDVRIELRTRYALNSMLLFAVTTAVMVSFRLGPLGVSRDSRAVSTLAVLLWVAIFFAAMNGLSRTFVREEETRTVALRRLGGAAQEVDHLPAIPRVVRGGRPRRRERGGCDCCFG